MFKLRKNKTLLVILLLAAAVRVWGIGYGLPLFTQGDEASLMSGALRMLQLHTLIPALHPAAFRSLYYPPVIPYLLLPVLVPTLLLQYLLGGYHSWQQFQAQIPLHLTPIWIAARLLIVVLGVATVAVVYRIGQRLFDRRAGQFAALFLATSFLHVALSHVVRHWVPATLAFSLVSWMAVEILRRPTQRAYLLAGTLSGLAFGVSYITVIGLVPLLLAHALRWRWQWQKLFSDTWLWLSLSIFLILARLFVALHPQEFNRITTGEDSTAHVAKSLAGLVGEFCYHLVNLARLEPALLLGAGLGILLLATRRHWGALVLTLVTPLVYIPVLYLFFHSEVRYVSLLLPLLAVLAGFGLARVEEAISGPGRSRRIAVAGIIFLVFTYPAWVVARYDQLLTIPDTRQQAQIWIHQHVPAGAAVATSVQSFTLTAQRSSLVSQQLLDSTSLRETDRALLQLPPDQYLAPAYDLLRLERVADLLPRDAFAYLDEYHYRYLVVEEWANQTAPDYLRPLAARVQTGEATVLASFTQTVDDPNGNMYQPAWRLFRAAQLGPTVTVYRLSGDI